MLRASSPPRPDSVAVPAKAPANDPLLVDVVVLSGDLELFQSTRDAIGERNPVWRARSADEAADLLISGRCGVLLIDMGAVSTRADTLIHQVVDQFPDIVVCVAGSRSDEPLLAPLISDGLVYRFMHKPVSAKRAGMFLQAAIRRHAERRAGRETAEPLLPLLRSLRPPSTGLPPRYMGLLAAACALLLSPFLFDAVPTATRAPEPQTSEPKPTALPGPPEQRANAVLSRARAALQAGRLEAPEGRNALDLFESVLLAQPDQSEAKAGLRRTIESLLQLAEDEAAAGRKDEAARLARRVLAVEPEQARAQALLRRLNPPPDTPSRQLEREQAARAERAVRPEPAAPLKAAPLARGDMSARAPAAGSPGPAVTPAATPAARPAPSPAPATSPRNLQPQPDPLAPRYTNAKANPAKANGRPRSFGTPITPQHAIAGTAAPVPPVASYSPPAVAAPDTATPADEFDRIVARDPVYPPDAFRNGVSGWVELEFTITETGTVRDVVTVAAEPLGVFERSAIQALADWQFRPRVVNGRPVAQRSTITMRFDVDD